MSDCEYPTLKRLVMKGVSSKAKAREAMEELQELIEALQTQYDALENGVCDWEDGDDAETRAEGKDAVETVATDLDGPLTQAGRACGMADYDPPEEP